MTEIAISMEQWQAKEKKTEKKQFVDFKKMIFGWSVTERAREKQSTHSHTPTQTDSLTNIRIVLQSGLRVWLLPNWERKNNTIIARLKIHRSTTMGWFRCHFRVYSKQCNNLYAMPNTHTRARTFAFLGFAFIGLGKIKDHAKVYKR